MPDINLSPYTAESEAIARRIRMAEALQQQASSPMEMPTLAGARISPYAGLAKMLQAYSATRMRGKAEEREKTLADTARADTSADFGALLKGLTPTAAVPEGPSTFTANVDQRDIAENPRMVMQPERNEMNEIIQPGEAGAGYFGVTPGTPAIPASAGRLTAEGFGAMKTPAGQQQYMAQLLAQMKPREQKWELKEIKTADGGTKTMLLDMNAPNPMSTATEQGMQKPVKKPIVVGNALVDPDTFQAVYTGPKAARTGNLGDYDEYVAQQTKAGKKPVDFDQFLVNQKIAGRQPANVTYGSPISALDASGKPVFIQPGRAGGAPAVMEGFTPPAAKLKDVPPTVNTAMTQNQIVLNKLDRIDDLLVKTPDATGILKGITPGIILNRLDKEGTALRAALTELAATKVHDLSGAAVSASEFGRLKPFLPQPTDDANTIKTKLAGMKAEIQDIMNATNSIYSEDQGYKPIPNLAPKPAETPPISALKEGQTTTFKNGQSWTLQQGKPVQVK
jgi:hypothetical protein